MKSRHHLVFMVRAPQMGRVKQRLARDLGAGSALRFYRLCTERLLRRLGRDPRWTTCWRRWRRCPTRAQTAR